MNETTLTTGELLKIALIARESINDDLRVYRCLKANRYTEKQSLDFMRGLIRDKIVIHRKARADYYRIHRHPDTAKHAAKAGLAEARRFKKAARNPLVKEAA